MRNCGVIVAAGKGSRMGLDIPKVLMDINGKPALWWTILAFESCDQIDEICVVCDDIVYDAIKPFGFGKLKYHAYGGNTRSDSVFNGLSALPTDTDIAAVHDGARLCITGEVIAASVECAIKHDTAITARLITDTIHRADEECYIINTPDRDNLWSVQTPQTFSYRLLLDAYKHAMANDFAATDDASVVINYGKDVKLFIGDDDNIKLTTKDDIIAAKRILNSRKSVRAGIGYDTHVLVEGRELILGGVNIPYDKGLLGHSDADVLTHAIMDALLGCAGLPDIGQLFPDTDPKYKDARSVKLLGRVAALVREAGYYINNVDAVIICQQPKIAPHKGEIIHSLANTLNMDAADINIKATTTEGMNAEGRGEAISSQAIVSIS